MAESAHSLNDDEQPGRVYDQSGTSASSPKPDLKVLEGGGETSEPKRGHLREAGDEKKSTGSLSEAESSPGSAPTEDSEKSFYRKGGETKRTGFLRGPGTGKGWRQKRVVLGLAVFVAGIAASIIIFLALLPLKILHIVNNLEERFYATSQTAIQNETDSLMKQYIVQHVLPSYRSCGTTISKDCSVKVAGTNPVSNLYKTWANARLENKLATDYGIEFQKRADGWYLKTPSTSGNGINIGEEGQNFDDGFRKANPTEFRQAVKDETRWYQVFIRFKVGSLLKEKYGIRRFIPGAALQTVADQKIAAKLFLTQRVLVPRTQTLGIAIECLLSGCKATDYEPTDATPGDNGALGGTPEDKASDTAIRDGLTKLAASYGITDAATIAALEKTYADMSEKGFTNYVISEGLAKLPFVSEDAAAGASDKIPYIGWINMLSQIIVDGNNAGPNLKKLSYVTNATAAVALFSMYRTYADEIKVGDPNINATEVGSFTDSLGPGGTNSSNDPEVGGNVGAEGAPLYSSLIDGNNSAPAGSSVSLGGALTSKVLAAGTTSTQNPSANSYTCNNGKPVPNGKLVCNEEVLGEGNNYANILHDVLNLPFISVFTKIAGLWHSTIGSLLNWLSNVFSSVIQGIVDAANATCHVPGATYVSPYCEAKKLADQYLPQIEQAVVQWLIPDPFSSNMSGGRTFDMMAAGADVAGNDSAHTTLGGQQLSDQQTATIVNEQYNEELQEYKNEPFFARLTDTNSNYSPVSRMAMAMPTSWSSGLQSVASLFSNPLTKLGHAFSAIFSPNLAFAASTRADPFGVTQYGYPAGSIPSDPETYWDNNCSDNAAFAYRKDNSWNETAATTLDSNEMPDNKTVNPCLLIMSTTGSDGGFYDSSLLTPDDLSNQ